MNIKTGILTLSDRSAKGERPDISGPILQQAVIEQGWTTAKTQIISDDFESIKLSLIMWVDVEKLDLILTTGGTGFGPRDVTPEATLAVIHRLSPGLSEAMRAFSQKITPYAMLSRAVAGIRNQTLIINLPGSPKAALDNFQVLIPVLPHAIDLIHNHPSAESGHNIPTNHG